MNNREHLAIIGSGASSIYLLKHLLDNAELLKPFLREISVFEKSRITGMGMPYSPLTTDRFNMSNISSEELPELTVSFADWLRAQEPSLLKALDLDGVEISDSAVYNRLALGQYLNEQYKAIISRLEAAGIQVTERPGCEVTDICHAPQGEKVTLHTGDGGLQDFDRVIIATGHCWAEEDNVEAGYYASPWPISKLIPREGELYNFAIGTLGASLSAFDVIASLAHRHGDFVEESGRMSFHPYAGTEQFKIIMHAAHGWLPHLQFDQKEPFRRIYRHVDRDGLLSLRDRHGFLRLEAYFDKVCRPALRKAFEKDKMPELVKRLSEPQFGLLDFVETMTEKHDYANAFEGMRFEMKEASKSVLNHQPIYWKEVVDDLMYTLNFHAELLPAEDYLTLKSKVMPFIMNVIAAMPLPSGNTILALYDAGKLDMVTGKASIAAKNEDEHLTTVTVDTEEEQTTIDYRMFIDCSGQKPVGLKDYPFPSLVKNGCVREARASFATENPTEALPDKKDDHLLKEGDNMVYDIGGVDIDGAYRLIGRDAKPNARVYDIAFPHTSGVRPYSYGLQACSDTSAILVQAWIDELTAAAPLDSDPAAITEVYEEVQAAQSD